MKKLSWNKAGCIALAIIGLGIGRAQETPDSFSSINLSDISSPSGVVALSGTNMVSLRSWSDDQLTILLGALGTTPTIATPSLPTMGTFWSLQNPGLPPLPSDTIGADAWLLSDGSYLLDDVGLDYNAVSASPMQMGAMDSGLPGPPGFGSDGGPAPNGPAYIPPDYGTNLWIAQWSLATNIVTGIASNTIADVEYEMQWSTNLLQTNWASVGFILGSELTNWTSLIPQFVVPTNNGFLRLRSWISSDGSGLPDWWELEYFGTNGIDPNAPDSAGDGYTIYQKYQLGVPPNTFVTPLAPQGLTVSYNSSSGTATLNWLQSLGNVTNYTIERSYTNYAADPYSQISDLASSANSVGYVDNVSSFTADPWEEGNINLNYKIRANYTGGISAWSANIPIEAATFAGSISGGPNGSTVLAVTTMPANTTAISLTEIDDNTFDPDDIIATNFIVSISNFTNGIGILTNVMGFSSGITYFWLGQAIGTNGSLSAMAYLNSDITLPNNGNNLMTTPFYDGRVQLKQNLIFQLRAAALDSPLHFSIPITNHYAEPADNGSFGEYVGDYVYSAGYAYAGLYDFNNSDTQGYLGVGAFDPFLPFEENCLFRNFVFDVADVNGSGSMTTGASDDGLISLYLYGFSPGNDYVQLIRPLTYQFQANDPSFNDMLATSNTPWLFYDRVGAYDGAYNVGLININSTNQTVSLNSGYRNWFGLTYVSANVAYAHFDGSGNYVGLETNIVTAGNALTLSSGDFWGLNGNNIYLQTSQPLFQAVGYKFWNSDSVMALPGSSSFSPTNQSQLFTLGVGSQVQIAGYAKLEVTNSADTGVYGYLGQYFDQAYTMTNGVATSTNTGVLSPYGNFFATQPGPVALVTMPDPDNGEQGTCIVYCVSLALDKNHDGTMDQSFNGPDATTASSPFVFWANNNYDRYVLDSDETNYYDDDVAPNTQAATCPYTPNTPTPDCNYLDGDGHRVIPCARDLEDFTRLWICGITSNLLAALPAGSTVTLNWGDVGSPNSGNPAIDLFAAADADGGIGYLTNSSTADSQIDSLYCPYVGRLGPGSNLVLNASTFANNWAGNHFIWCGVSNGAGGLNLTIANSNGTVLAQTTAYIQIQDIKQMYERWTIGDNPNTAPLTNAIPATEDLPPFTQAFRYATPPDSNTPYILYVHGWNMNYYDKDRFAETAFKRLYWQGYQGRFGVFRWPTDYGFTGDSLINVMLNLHNYDNSEFNAWRSAQGLLNKLNDLNSQYPDHVYVLAHSMGNVVTGEALRLAAQNGDGQLVNTYVGSQAAIPAHVYDASVTSPYLIDYTYSAHGIPAPGAPKTPNIYGNRLTNSVVAAGRRISFYNINDYALNADAWCFDQELKPDTFAGGYYTYYGSLSDPPPWNNFEFVFTGMDPPSPTYLDIVTNLENRYEALAYAADPYSTALGATPIITFDQIVDLTTVWPVDTSGHNYSDHFWHSAEFRGDAWEEWNYWQTLLHSPTLGFNISN